MLSEELQEEFEITLLQLNNEGDGYFFTGYTSADYMPDDKSSELFKKALDSIEEFRAYIEGKVQDV
jgi:ADP-dependent phosphofructokinase/glucokinase